MFFILFNTVSYITLKFKLKIDPKCVILKTWKNFGNHEEIFEKTSGNPVSLVLVKKKHINKLNYTK